MAEVASSAIPRFDHVGITVEDLDAATAFFVALGCEVEGRTLLEGDFVDTVIGIRGSRVDMVLLRLPGGGTGLELSRFLRPEQEPGAAGALSTRTGLRNVTFEVDDLLRLVERLAGDGYDLVGGIGEDGQVWRMAQVRGPSGILVGLAERIGSA